MRSRAPFPLIIDVTPHQNYSTSEYKQEASKKDKKLIFEKNIH
jgi:hypothetical protein